MFSISAWRYFAGGLLHSRIRAGWNDITPCTKTLMMASIYKLFHLRNTAWLMQLILRHSQSTAAEMIFLLSFYIIIIIQILCHQTWYLLMTFFLKDNLGITAISYTLILQKNHLFVLTYYYLLSQSTHSNNVDSLNVCDNEQCPTQYSYNPVMLSIWVQTSNSHVSYSLIRNKYTHAYI